MGGKVHDLSIVIERLSEGGRMYLVSQLTQTTVCQTPVMYSSLVFPC